MERVRSEFFVILLLLALFFITQTAQGANLQQQLVSESTIEQVLKRGILRVGMSTFTPWAMRDKTGQWVGFEIDVATRLAQDMGVQVEFVPTKWSGIIPALLTGKFDVIIGGMGILPKRNIKVNFTVPYDITGMALVADKGLAGGFKGIEDFDRPDVTLSLRLAATPAAAAKKFMPKAQLRQFDDESQAIQELLNGKVHAMVASAPLPAHLAFKYPDKLFMPIEGTFTKEPIGFAVKKGDFDTINFFNNWITVVSAEGWLRERKHYWFETTEWEEKVK
ncbi:MAG: transporter substrate-binding domain-containing protein [Desulfatiglandales bacterium]